MGRGLLAVDETKVPSLELSDQPHESHFGSIVDSCKHGLRKERPTDGHTVESTDKATILPRLHGMGVAEVMESCVGVQHISGDPGAFLWVLWAWSCALFHDIAKAGIECDGEPVLAKAFLKTARHMKLVRK